MILVKMTLGWQLWNWEFVSGKDMAEDAEVGGNSNDGDDKTVERLPSKKSNVPKEYLTSLHSKKMSFP